MKLTQHNELNLDTRKLNQPEGGNSSKGLMAIRQNMKWFLTGIGMIVLLSQCKPDKEVAPPEQLPADYELVWNDVPETAQANTRLAYLKDRETQEVVTTEPAEVEFYSPNGGVTIHNQIYSRNIGDTVFILNEEKFPGTGYTDADSSIGNTIGINALDSNNNIIANGETELDNVGSDDWEFNGESSPDGLNILIDGPYGSSVSLSYPFFTQSGKLQELYTEYVKYDDGVADPSKTRRFYKMDNKVPVEKFAEVVSSPKANFKPIPAINILDTFTQKMDGIQVDREHYRMTLETSNGTITMGLESDAMGLIMKAIEYIEYYYFIYDGRHHPASAQIWLEKTEMANTVFIFLTALRDHYSIDNSLSDEVIMEYLAAAIGFNALPKNTKRDVYNNFVKE